MTPLVAPGVGNLCTAINRLLLVRRIRSVLKEHRKPGQKVQVWSFAPDVDYLAGTLGEEVFVYYCVDEFSGFKGFDSKAIVRAESRLMSVADVVFASSMQLYNTRKDCHPNIHMVRHGVDHDHFAKAVIQKMPIPDSIAHISKPIAGFVGLVQHWFDIELMRRVALRLPDVSFVVVGECQADVSALNSLSNFHFVGRQPYADLPAYNAAFDVGLIPFVRSAMTENVNPIKLREYLAAGLPVVSTALPEVTHFVPDVTLANDPESFAAACRASINSLTPQARQMRSLSVADQSWEAVTERVSQLVMQAVRRRNTRAVDTEPLRISGDQPASAC